MDDLRPLPPPDESSPNTTPASTPGGSNSDDRSSRRPWQILTPEQCLAGISQLAGLVMMDYLKPAQANAMRAAYGDVLRHHQADRRGASGTLPTETVLEFARRDPRLLNLFQQCLTDEQFQFISEQLRTDSPA